MLATVTHVLPLTTIRRERMLPIPGKVVVRKGQKVSANDTIAEADLNPEHLLIDIARGLGLSAQDADANIQVGVGDLLAEGDIIAGPVGITRRVVRAPKHGRVMLAGEGHVLMAVQNQPYELKAGLPGMVLDLLGDRGVLIETTGALIQGVWGNEKIDFGLMFVLAKKPDQVLQAADIDVSMRGSVIMAGYCNNPEALKMAASLPLRGMILGGMDPNLISLASKVPFPLIVISGFSQNGMDQVSFKLLSTNERREVSLNAETWDTYSGTRPEVIIQLPATGEPPLPHKIDFFKVEQQIRVTRAPYAGMVGIITSFDPGVYVYPNGLRAKSVEIRLENGETVILPLANLEVIE